MKKYLQACVSARYWEDAILNGVEDIDKNMPCIDGDLWKPLINLETGIIENWIIGNTANIYYKSCNQNSFYLLDENKNVIGKIEDDYVIDTMHPDNDGYRDYVIMQIDENGKILNFKDLTDKDNWIN